MPRLQVDPRLFPNPDFSLEIYKDQRASLINDGAYPTILTEEQATRKLEEDHERFLTSLVTQWDQQVAEDKRLEEEKQAQDEEERRLRLVEVQKKTQAVLAEKEKKRIPLVDFDVSKPVDLTKVEFHPTAVKKAEAREFEHLWYYGAKAAQEALEMDRYMVDDGSFNIAHDENGNVTFRAANSPRSSRNCVPDANLMFPQVMVLKAGFLTCIGSMPSIWPAKWINMFGQYFIAMEMHPEAQALPYGHEVMAMYHAETRAAWFRKQARGEGPGNLAIINEDIIRDCRNKVLYKHEQERVAREKQRDAKEKETERRLAEL